MNGKVSAGRIFGIKHGELCKFEQRPGYAQLDGAVRGDYIIYGGPPEGSFRPLLFSSGKFFLSPNLSFKPDILVGKAAEEYRVDARSHLLCITLHHRCHVGIHPHCYDEASSVVASLARPASDAVRSWAELVCA